MFLVNLLLHRCILFDEPCFCISAKRISLMINMMGNKKRGEDWQANRALAKDIHKYLFFSQQLHTDFFIKEMTCKLMLCVIILITINSISNFGVNGATRDQVIFFEIMKTDVSKWNSIACRGSIQSTFIKSSYIETSACYLCWFECEESTSSSDAKYSLYSMKFFNWFLNFYS